MTKIFSGFLLLVLGLGVYVWSNRIRNDDTDDVEQFGLHSKKSDFVEPGGDDYDDEGGEI